MKRMDVGKVTKKVYKSKLRERIFPLENQEKDGRT